MAELLNVDEALAQILHYFEILDTETVTIRAALGRSLAQDIRAEINLPPFANSSMDGYAVRATDLQTATRQTPVRLQVVMDIPAGTAPTAPLMQGQAARIMTGAPVPKGADAIVPVEDTDGNWRTGEAIRLVDQVEIYRNLNSGDYIRPAGENVQIGQVVLKTGTLLRPQDLGMLAALGCIEVPVVRQPRVAIVSSGDELVDAGDTLVPGKIRDVNSYTIAGSVSDYGGIPLPLPIARDTLDDVRALFKTALDLKPDVIISTAGVSVGTYDVVRSVLDDLGHVHFWRVNIRPGKPLAFGLLQSVPFFGLPGNPVSAMVTFDVFARPALLKLLGRSDNTRTVVAVVGENLHSDGRRSYLRVRLEETDGQWTAFTTGTQSSGALMSMVEADGLLIIPEEVTFVQAGTRLPVRLLRD